MGNIKAKPIGETPARRPRIRHHRTPESSASRPCARPRQTPPPIPRQTTGTAGTTCPSAEDRILPPEAPLPELPTRGEKKRTPSPRPRKAVPPSDPPAISFRSTTSGLLGYPTTLRCSRPPLTKSPSALPLRIELFVVVMEELHELGIPDRPPEVLGRIESAMIPRSIR